MNLSRVCTGIISPYDKGHKEKRQIKILGSNFHFFYGIIQTYNE